MANVVMFVSRFCKKKLYASLLLLSQFAVSDWVWPFAQQQFAQNPAAPYFQQQFQSQAMQYPQDQYPGMQYSQAMQYPGMQYPGMQYPGMQYPQNMMNQSVPNVASPEVMELNDSVLALPGVGFFLMRNPATNNWSGPQQIVSFPEGSSFVIFKIPMSTNTPPQETTTPPDFSTAEVKQFEESVLVLPNGGFLLVKDPTANSTTWISPIISLASGSSYIIVKQFSANPETQIESNLRHITGMQPVTYQRVTVPYPIPQK
jgi:hypothetical protein